MAEGFGIGGYGGLDEPWGSVEFPIPSSLNRNAASTGYLGIIEATTGIIGEADNEIGGFRSTRLITVANISDTYIDVESTLNWDTTGKISIEGVVYYYTNITATTIDGLSYIQNEASVSGIAKIHHIESAVIDLNRNYSALDKLRRALLVDYAEGEDLKVIGRDLGVPYISLFGEDDQYREIIKATAYSPRGTTYGIETALDAILGIGTYEIYEDLISRPCEIIIKVDDSTLVEDNPFGKTYLSENLYSVTSGSSATIVLDYTPLGVSWLKLKDLSELFDFRDEIPSSTTYLYYPDGSTSNAFTYSGTLTESSAVTNSSGLHTVFNLASAPNTAYYEMLDTQGARIEEESIVDIDTVIAVPVLGTLTSGLLEQISISIGDGNCRISVGVDSGFELGLFDTEGGGFLGDTHILLPGVFNAIRLIKYKNETVSLYVNTELVTTVSYSLFTTSYSDHKILFGLQGTPAVDTSFYIKQLSVNISNNEDKWSSTFSGIGFTSNTTPNKFSITGTHYFEAGDVGDYFEVIESTATNLYGGNNNGKYVISTYLSSTAITLNGIIYSGATIDEDTLAVLTLPDNMDRFTYPDDLGKKVEISNSSLGNNGIYTITGLLEEGTLTDFASYATENTEKTSICVLNSGALVSEVNLDYAIIPDFVTDSSLGLIHSGTGTQTTNTLTIRDGLWDNDLVVEVGISNVLTGQLLENTEIDNMLISSSPLLYEYYPFYLSDKLGILEDYLDDLTIAGVIPKIDSR